MVPVRRLLLSLLLLALLVPLAGAHASPGGHPTLRQGKGPLPEWARRSWLFRREIDTPVALVDANVVDLDQGTFREGVHVVLRGDRIVSVGPEFPPDDARVIDARGLWVVPGLFDLHAHVVPRTPFYPAAPPPEEMLAELLRHGVTTIRCLPLTSEPAHDWAAQISQGKLLGPTMVVSGPVFEQRPLRTSFGFGDPQTASTWVQREALNGSRWIKVYNAMDRASLAAIVETAHEHGLRVCGHAEEVPPREASELGMDTIEHIVSIPLSCMRPAEEPRGLDLLALTAWRWEQYDVELGHKLMRLFHRNGTAWVPTLVITERTIEAEGHDGRSQKAPQVLESLRAGLHKAARLAVHLHRIGGRVGLGTDFPVDGVAPGSSAQRELELLVQLGGATPLEALRIGTASSADILGHAPLLGRVEPGALAHLLLVRRNPLEDITGLREVAMVVHDGRVLELQ